MESLQTQTAIDVPTVVNENMDSASGSSLDRESFAQHGGDAGVRRALRISSSEMYLSVATACPLGPHGHTQQPPRRVQGPSRQPPCSTC